MESALRRSGAGLPQASEALADAGLWAESVALTQDGRLSWAEQIVTQAACLTVADDAYPCRLLKLGDAAPPAFWRVGEIIPALRIAIVGSRSVSHECLAYTRGIAREALDLGFGIVSGGAAGCDSAAADEAGVHALEILPYGISHHRYPRPAISLCAPDEPFSAATAMERNALIYASCEQAIVVHGRLREGGTWAGASEALRRRLCPILVREADNPAQRALNALGARLLKPDIPLASALMLPPTQPQLMSA